jgi:UDP-glucose 4-epimerase
MKILIAGAAGFIGSNLTSALTAAGHEVIAILRPNGSIPADWAGVTILRLDLASLAEATLPQVDVVIHLAQSAQPFPAGAMDLLAVNCYSAVALAAHAIRCGAKKMIYASSGTVYGFSSSPVTEGSPLAGTGFYAQSKIAAERLLAEFRSLVPVDILRIFTPYGPGQQPFRLIPDIVSRVRDGRPVSVRTNGMPFLSPVAVSDVVAAIEARLAATDSQTINVAGPEVVGIREIAEALGAILGRSPTYEENSAPLDGGMASNSKFFSEITGIVPLGLEAGLRRLVSSFAQGNR